jgi:phage terminase large subunit
MARGRVPARPKTIDIALPVAWVPRPYQMPLWRYLEDGGKRAIGIWHRRAGKDDVLLNWGAVAAHQRVGCYWHMLPQASQARKAIWEAVNPHSGRKRIDEAFPSELRKSTRNSDMRIEFLNGSTWQVLGSDNYNSLVGTTPIGVTFSEWALADPGAGSYLRPALAENGGWAAFITTPRGRNQAARMYEAALGDPTWFAQRLGANDTGVFGAELLAQERAEYIRERGEEDGEALFNQEYHVDFDAALVGSYYGRWMAKADQEGRIGTYPHQGGPVWTAWDLGMSDSTAIWFFERAGSGWRVIDYLEANGQGLEFYADHLKDRGYRYEGHILPHDAEVRELGTGKSRRETLQSLGLAGIVIAAKLSVADGIQAVRQLLPTCAFNVAKCERGLDALRQYRRIWNEKLKMFNDSPSHDWTSHASDSFRYGAVGLPVRPLDDRWRAKKSLVAE